MLDDLGSPDQWILSLGLSDLELYEKEKELNILPLKLKFLLNDLVLFYKITNFLVPITLPSQFTVIDPNNVRYTRSTQNVIELNDKTRYKCNIKPSCNIFENCFFYKTINIWNQIPFDIRQIPNIAIFKLKLINFLWSVESNWPD